MKITIRAIGVFKILKPLTDNNEIFDASLLKKHILSAVNEYTTNLCVDLSDMTNVYSDTLNVLIESNKILISKMGRLTLLIVSDKINKVFEDAGLTNVIRIYRKEDEIFIDSKEILRQTQTLYFGSIKKNSDDLDDSSISKDEFSLLKEELGDVMQEKPKEQEISTNTELDKDIVSVSENANEVSAIEIIKDDISELEDTKEESKSFIQDIISKNNIKEALKTDFTKTTKSVEKGEGVDVVEDADVVDGESLEVELVEEVQEVALVNGDTLEVEAVETVEDADVVDGESLDVEQVEEVQEVALVNDDTLEVEAVETVEDADVVDGESLDVELVEEVQEVALVNDDTLEVEAVETVEDADVVDGESLEVELVEEVQEVALDKNDTLEIEPLEEVQEVDIVNDDTIEVEAVEENQNNDADDELPELLPVENIENLDIKENEIPEYNGPKTSLDIPVFINNEDDKPEDIIENKEENISITEEPKLVEETLVDVIVPKVEETVDIVPKKVIDIKPEIKDIVNDVKDESPSPLTEVDESKKEMDSKDLMSLKLQRFEEEELADALGHSGGGVLSKILLIIIPLIIIATLLLYFFGGMDKPTQKVKSKKTIKRHSTKKVKTKRVKRVKRTKRVKTSKTK